MAWGLTASSLLLTIVVQIILLIVSLIYNKKVIQPNRDKSLWKIRRPKYLLFYLIITLLNGTLRCLCSLLSSLNMINLYEYSLLSVPLAYYGGITWGSIRLYLLYYDIKIAKKNRLFLFSKHLTTMVIPETFENESNTKQYKLKKYQWITMKVVFVVTIFVIITLFMDFFRLFALSKLLTYCFIISVLILYTYFIIKMCSCFSFCKSQRLKKSPFRDDWSLLYELTIIWIIWIIGVVAAILFLPFKGTSIHEVLIAFLTMMTRTSITFTLLYVPYKLSKKLNQDRNNQTVTLQTLKKILSKKQYFFNFVQHLVQELSIENLTFLVEIWQFKYERKYHLKPTVKSEKINIEIEKSRTSPTRSNNADYSPSPHTPPTTYNEEWIKDIVPTVEYEDDTPQFDVMRTNSDMSTAGSTPTQNDTDLHDDNVSKHAKLVKFVESLPWRSLPLAQSISLNLCNKNMNKKWDQCYQIFVKYLDENSYHAVNVSYTARNEINFVYNELLQYKHFKMSDSLKENEMPPTIKTDEEFNAKLVNVFDGALQDIIDNLRDSVTRFVKTDEFGLEK